MLCGGVRLTDFFFTTAAAAPETEQTSQTYASHLANWHTAGHSQRTGTQDTTTARDGEEPAIDQGPASCAMSVGATSACGEPARSPGRHGDDGLLVVLRGDVRGPPSPVGGVRLTDGLTAVSGVLA